MTTLTANEIEVLNGIAYHEMAPSNGEKPETIADTGTYCWVEDFSASLTPSQVKGVLSSLVKKGLIHVDDYDDEDTVVNFTDTGFKVWQENDDDRA